MEDDDNDLQCRVCSAHATGFHFDAQSCSACCAFFRRAISLRRVYKCERDNSASNESDAPLCSIVYTERKLCRACRLRKCLAVGMNESCVQGPKSISKKMRAYCTSSGLRRNKRFSVISNVNHTVWRKECSATLNAPQSYGNVNSNEELRDKAAVTIQNESNDVNESPDAVSSVLSSAESEVSPLALTIDKQLENSDEAVQSNENVLHKHHEAKRAISITPAELPPPFSNSYLSSQSLSPPASWILLANLTPMIESMITSGSNTPLDLLSIFVMEEMRIAERRRILFCERPVGSLLGNTKNGPFTVNDIRPLNFHEFRRSVRIHILLIYEWLRVFPYYEHLCKHDQLTLLRKSVLYHTILDPCFITLQVGDMSKFVLQNGGYVSTVEDSDDGWHDENEISRDNKKKIYWPLLKRLMRDIIAQMVTMNLQFEEFVAVKALVSIQMTICDASDAGRALMRHAMGRISQSLYEHCNLGDDLEKATRLGNILLLLSPIIDTATDFVESHHEVQFFDLWKIDSLLLQFLKNKV